MPQGVGWRNPTKAKAAVVESFYGNSGPSFQCVELDAAGHTVKKMSILLLDTLCKYFICILVELGGAKWVKSSLKLELENQ